MTGTAATEAEEFYQIYKLEVVTIPTNKPVRRQDDDDVVYMTRREKYNASFRKSKIWLRRKDLFLLARLRLRFRRHFPVCFAQRIFLIAFLMQNTMRKKLRLLRMRGERVLLPLPRIWRVAERISSSVRVLLKRAVFTLSVLKGMRADVLTIS